MVAFSGFKKMDGKAFILSDLENKGLQVFFNFSCKDLPALLDRPYHMVIDIIHAGACMD